MLLCYGQIAEALIKVVTFSKRPNVAERKQKNCIVEGLQEVKRLVFVHPKQLELQRSLGISLANFTLSL